jgi:hypothetical protein
MTVPNQFQKSIRAGDRVTILVPSGLGRGGQEYRPMTGRAVMYSAHGGWVLNMGGEHGRPGIADETNTIKVTRRSRARERALPKNEKAE